MKRILWLCMAVAAALLTTSQAQVVRIATVKFTGLPADGNKITVNGVDRTFKTVVSSAPVQVQIGGTALLTANNYVSQLSSFAYSNLSIHQSGSTVFLVARVDAALTASVTGAWGTVSVSTQDLSDSGGLILPLAQYPPGSRAMIGNRLVDALSVYPTVKIASTATALGNFFALDQANKTTGANVFSNATQVFTSGYVSNTTLTNIPIAWITNLNVVTSAAVKEFYITNGTPFIYMVSSVGPSDSHKTYIYSAPTEFAVQFQNDAGSTLSNVFAINRNGNAGVNATFTVPIVAPLITAISTNGSSTNTYLHALTAWLDRTVGRGEVTISNALPKMALWSTGPNANLRRWSFNATGGGALGEFAFNLESDDGATVTPVFGVSRGGSGLLASDALVSFASHVEFQNGLEVSTGDLLTPDNLIGGTGLILGSFSTALPAGLFGGAYFFDGSAPIGDPATGWAAWSESGNLKYRGSAASEGSGRANRFHNRTDSVFAAGTDYTLTGSTAFVDCGTTDPKVTLPTDGTYLIFADVAFEGGASANDDYRAKLRNETAAADLSGSDQSITYLGASQFATVHLEATVATTSASNVIAIWAHNNTAARGKVNSARTRIGYVRLY